MSCLNRPVLTSGSKLTHSTHKLYASAQWHPATVQEIVAALPLALPFHSFLEAPLRFRVDSHRVARNPDRPGGEQQWASVLAMSASYICTCTRPIRCSKPRSKSPTSPSWPPPTSS